MNNKIKSLYIIERLSLKSWFFSVIPYWLREKRGLNKRFCTCLIFNSTWVAYYVAAISARVINVVLKKFKYSIVDAHDINGISIRLKVAYRDMAKVQNDIIKDPVYQRFVNQIPSEGKIKKFVEKSLASYDPVGIESLDHIWNALILIKVAEWELRKSSSQNRKCVLFLKRRRWFWVIQEYAERHGIELKAYNVISILKSNIKRILLESPYVRFWIKIINSQKRSRLTKHLNSSIPKKTMTPHLAVEYYGHFNLDKQECYSDLFFWQQSELDGKYIVLMFGSLVDRVDMKKLDKLVQHRIKSVDLSTFGIDKKALFLRKNRIVNNTVKNVLSDEAEAKWLKKMVTRYNNLRDYWIEVFERHNVKVYTHWYKYDANHMAIADALESLGGVMTLYQRSYEALPTPETTLAVDIQFTFSRFTAEIEKQNRSSILYHVITGYLGDHRFPMLQRRAKNIRELLRQQGAEFIISFFDENTADDPRWFPGHNFTSENYAYILEKVLNHQWAGLVLKPKNPINLHQRLGEVAFLLEEVKATGRCYVFDVGPVQGSYPPAVAALASDVAIHEFLSSGTAGLESALCGVPTLLLDREGWPLSNLYELGVGKVVFTEWQDLWEACNGYRKASGSFDGFGKWTPLLDEIDPFRDGRAAERMGTYLKWLMDGFRAGLPRNTIMADAAERYCQLWGDDKIAFIHGEPDS
jgi:hypothetical protein